MTTIRDRARTLGGYAAEGYRNQAGHPPGLGSTDAAINWGTSAWEQHWKGLVDEGATGGDYEVCLAAWRSAFWGT